MAVLTNHLPRGLILTNCTFCFFSQVTEEYRLGELVMFWLRTPCLTYTSFCDGNKRYGVTGIFIDCDASDE